jgi:hypothetical protein
MIRKVRGGRPRQRDDDVVGWVGVGHAVIEGMDAPATVLFRVEGARRCEHCNRLHPYCVGDGQGL